MTIARLAESMTNPKNIIGLAMSPARPAENDRAIAGREGAKAIFTAEKFVLDEAAIRTVFQLSLSGPEVIAELLRDAKPPFSHMWVELSLKEKLAVAAELGALDLDTVNYNGMSKDMHFGCAITDVNGTVNINMLQHAEDGKHVEAWAPTFQYHYEATPFTMLREPDYLTIRAYGYDVPTLPQKPIARIKAIRYLAQQSRVQFPAALAGDTAINQALKIESVNEIAGTLRFIVTLLALLNSAPVEIQSHRPPGRQIIGGKVRGYFVHNTCRINIPPKIIERPARLPAFLRNEQARRRAHMVRGHWVRYSTEPPMDWTPMLCEPPSWLDLQRRPNCKWRRWRQDHQRGDASLGFVQREYSVGAPKT